MEGDQRAGIEAGAAPRAAPPDPVLPATGTLPEASPGGLPVIDRALHAAEARWTQGLSPTAVASAWAERAGRAPGRRMALATQAAPDMPRPSRRRSRGGAPPQRPVPGDPSAEPDLVPPATGAAEARLRPLGVAPGSHVPTP